MPAATHTASASRPRAPRGCLALAFVGLVALPGCVENACDSTVSVFAYGTLPERRTFDVQWNNGWIGDWQDPDSRWRGEYLWQQRYLDEPRQKCILHNGTPLDPGGNPSDGVVRLASVEGVRLVWEVPDEEPWFEAHPINDGRAEIPVGAHVDGGEGSPDIPVSNGTVQLIGATTDGDRWIMGESEPFTTAPGTPCLINGPIYWERSLNWDWRWAASFVRLGSRLRIPLINAATCDPADYEGIRYDPGSGQVTVIDTDLTDGEVNWHIPTTDASLDDYQQVALMPRVDGRPVGGTGEVRLVPNDEFSGDESSAVEGCGDFLLSTDGDVSVGERVDVAFDHYAACERWAGLGNGGFVLRRVDEPGIRVPVTLDGAGATPDGFQVPWVPTGDYVFSVDQTVASIDSEPFHVQNATADSYCGLSVPTTTVFIGDEVHGPIDRAATCWLQHLDGLYLDTVGERWLVESGADLADGRFEFVVPLDAPPGPARLDLEGYSLGFGPEFELALRDCGLKSPTRNSVLRVGTTVPIPIDRGDVCRPDSRYDGAFLLSVDDPSADPVEIADDLSLGEFSFDVPDVADGTYTIALGTLAVAAVVSPEFEIEHSGGSTCGIQVDAPTPGELVTAGQTIDVVWGSDCDVPLDIDLKKGTFPFTTLATVAEDEADDGAATVTIPVNTVAGSDYRLCVRTPDGQSVDCSAAIEIEAPSSCVASESLTWEPGTGESQPVPNLAVILAPSSNPDLIKIVASDASEEWQGLIYITPLPNGQALVQAAPLPLPDAQGESSWSRIRSELTRATSTTVAGTVTTWVPGEELTITGLDVVMTFDLMNGTPTDTGSLKGSFTYCFTD